MPKALIRWLAAVGVAAASALSLVFAAGAASDVQVTALDCALHPRKIAIQNKGDTAQSLAGWKLLSDKPNEVFDLGVVGSVGAGETFYVYNGHLAPSTPIPPDVAGAWIYGWNPSEVYDPSLFVINEDGKDFIRLVNATQLPWVEVSAMPCPGTLEIPPLEQPQATPTSTPSSTGPGADGNTGQTDGNQAASAQTDAAQSTGASQNVTASANPAGSSGAGATSAQTRNASGQLAAGPASGAGGLLVGSGGSPIAALPLPLALLGLVVGAALALIGAHTLRRALRRP
jgi:hypothetical protein